MQVRLLPSTPPRRSSAEQSAALRRRRSHVRIVPARPALADTPEETPLAASANGRGAASTEGQALVAQEAERVPGTDEVVGATPPEGPTEGIRPDEEPVCYAGTGRQPVWVRVPPLPQHAAMVERSRHRALNPEAGVRFPVAVRTQRMKTNARWSSGKTSGCYPE